MEYIPWGTIGQFANLRLKNALEIPMSILLPSGCELIRPTITGTDIDAMREVNGFIALYETKHVGAEFGVGQKRAMFSMLRRNGVDFLIFSRWQFHDLLEYQDLPNVTDWIKVGYSRFAIPKTAFLFCKPQEKNFVHTYLNDSGIRFASAQSNQSGCICHRFDIAFDDYSPTDYIMQPTPEWLKLAHLVDAFAAQHAP